MSSSPRHEFIKMRVNIWRILFFDFYFIWRPTCKEKFKRRKIQLKNFIDLLFKINKYRNIIKLIVTFFLFHIVSGIVMEYLKKNIQSQCVIISFQYSFIVAFIHNDASENDIDYIVTFRLWLRLKENTFYICLSCTQYWRCCKNKALPNITHLLGTQFH